MWTIKATAALVALAAGPGVVYDIPPVKTSVRVENTPVTITAWGRVAQRDAQHYDLKVSADLSDLQRNATALLRAQLDRSEGCGERVAIQDATLTPAAPAGLLVTKLHYERWGCAKVFGKQMTSKLVGGDAVVHLKLNTAVDNGSTIRLVPELGEIEADGTLGELLRSGSLGAALREKVSNALVSAMQKGTDLSVTVPPAVKEVATIRGVQFTDAGAGKLGLQVTGDVRMASDQVDRLLGQRKSAAVN